MGKTFERQGPAKGAFVKEVPAVSTGASSAGRKTPFTPKSHGMATTSDAPAAQTGSTSAPRSRQNPYSVSKDSTGVKLVEVG